MKMIKKILLLGSGALKIGEAGEFDYSGTQAIKALKEEGKKVILVNPNIATVQTSEHLADEIYFHPVNAFFVEKIIAKEKPDGILFSFGGQTALNCGIDLYQKGILNKYHVEVLGTPIQAVIDTEDRKLFAQKLADIDLKTAAGKNVTSIKEAVDFAKHIGFPVMLRTGFALGGTGSGVIYNHTDLVIKVSAALAVYPQLIIEECLYGWKEIEYEVVRDEDDNCITVCNMENFDPTGIHTGESIVVAPSQTLSNHEYYFFRELAIKAIRSFKIVGECNIQFALHPDIDDYRVIEVNARLSRSSALASKATGYPLAYVAAKLALGKKLWEIPNSVTKKTTAFFEPALDYIVVKIPRWDIDKFSRAESIIGSEMKSVGEVMSIGRTFEEAIQKGCRMLNDGYVGVMDKQFAKDSKKILLQRLQQANTMRLFTICSAIREGVTLAKIHELTKIDRWFLLKLRNIVDVYQTLEKKQQFDRAELLLAKQLGFSDLQIGDLIGSTEAAIRKKRKALHIEPFVKRIDTMSGEFPAQTNYLYLTYCADESDYIPDNKERKVIVLGGGPYAIGTSVEFDWCAVETMKTVRKQGYKGIMINCNPETVSTDYDNSNFLYFEELTHERVLDIYDKEQAPCILSVGGQIPNNLSLRLNDIPLTILGPQPEQVRTAENRQQFSALLDTLHIAQPPWGRVTTLVGAKKLAQKLGFPILVRPSFVLSGKAMRVIDTEDQLTRYMQQTELNLKDHPLLVTRFLENYGECDFDGVAQDGQILISALSEHIEGAGVHSGDSSLIFPAININSEIRNIITAAADKIMQKLLLTGPFNIQFLYTDREVLVIECNARASRSFPFVSKVMGENFIELATKVSLGQKIIPRQPVQRSYYGVKVPQFSFRKLKGADPILKVEMNSTGEVAALGTNVHAAYLTALFATGIKFPEKKAAMVTLGGFRAKLAFISACKKLVALGYALYATAGTHFFLKENHIDSVLVGKIYEKDDYTVLNLLREKKIDFVVNIPERGEYEQRSEKTLNDGYNIRRATIDFGVPVFTNKEAAEFFIDAISEFALDTLPVLTLNEYRQLKGKQ